MKLPLVPSAAEHSETINREFSQLLQTDLGQVPDPKSLDNWENEITAMNKWPPTMIQDIGIYLTKMETFREGPSARGDQVTFRERIMSDYKDQKAYSYFSSNWQLDILFHPIEDGFPYCFLKSKCIPSQRINNVPHDTWVLINKETGSIISAYCTCFAG